MALHVLLFLLVCSTFSKAAMVPFFSYYFFDHQASEISTDKLNTSVGIRVSSPQQTSKDHVSSPIASNPLSDSESGSTPPPPAPIDTLREENELQLDLKDLTIADEMSKSRCNGR